MKMGRAAALLLSHVSIQICSFVAPRRAAHFDRNATTPVMTWCTSI